MKWKKSIQIKSQSEEKDLSEKLAPDERSSAGEMNVCDWIVMWWVEQKQVFVNC